MNEVKYHPQLKVTNLDQLPHGLNCKYLLAIDGPNGSYIAHSWKREKPKSIPDGHTLILLRGAK
jgi:hypothetical protein